MSAKFATAVTAVSMAIVAVSLGVSRTATPPVTPALGAALAVAADLDGGGVVDTAIVQGDEIDVTLSERHATVKLPALSGTTALAAGDIDADGDIDLLSLGRDGLRVWINHGSGAFTASTVMLPWQPVAPVHLQAARWSQTAPMLLSIVAGRSPSDGVVPAPVASAAPAICAGRLTSVADRAPPRFGAASCSPRAPPPTFLS